MFFTIILNVMNLGIFKKSKMKKVKIMTLLLIRMRNMVNKEKIRRKEINIHTIGKDGNLPLFLKKDIEKIGITKKEWKAMMYIKNKLKDTKNTGIINLKSKISKADKTKMTFMIKATRKRQMCKGMRVKTIGI